MAARTVLKWPSRTERDVFAAPFGTGIVIGALELLLWPRNLKGRDSAAVL